MAKITLPTITSLTNEESALAALLEWKGAIEAAIELTYSRNGQSPNTMSDLLDMNGFRIINVPAPTDDNDVVRLIDVAEGIKGDKGDVGPAGSVTDGDKGDIVVSSDGGLWMIDSGVLSDAGRTLINDASVSAMRTTLELGDSATRNVGTSAGTVAAGDDSRFNRYTINNRTADYTIALTDATTPTIVRHNSGVAHAFTIDPVGTTAYPVGCQIVIQNIPTGGVITLTRGSGVALYTNGSTTSANATLATGGVCTLIQTESNQWIAIGSGLS